MLARSEETREEEALATKDLSKWISIVCLDLFSLAFASSLKKKKENREIPKNEGKQEKGTQEKKEESLVSDGTEPLFRDTFILTVDGDW